MDKRRSWDEASMYGPKYPKAVMTASLIECGERVAYHATEADGRGLQLRGRQCSIRSVVASRAAAA
jgi:hypothetical protein